MKERRDDCRVAAGARNRLAALLCAAILIVACDASYPTTPSPAVPVALQLHFGQTLGEASVRASYSFVAYVLRSDGAWHNATTDATWSSPDPSVFRSLGTGGFVAERPGTAGVRVELQGLEAFVAIVVIDPARQPLPRLAVRGVPPRTVGATAQTTAALLQSPALSSDVTAQAAWASSDPSVATVDGGRVTALRPGTVRITAMYDGLSAYYVFSISPPDR
jgi:hypothetical protein